MAVTQIESAGEILVSVAGSAQIGEAEALAAELRRVLETKAATVRLCLDEIAQVDVSFFQLLLALGASLEAQGRRLLIGKLPAGHAVMETSVLLGIGLGPFMPVDAA
jgi:hypothetical protein